MLIFAIIAVFVAVALIAWLVYNFAVYALPALVAIFAARALHTAGLEWTLAVPGGALAGIATFAIGQVSLAFVKSTWARLLIIAAFVTPAAIAGYYAAFGLSEMVSPSPATRTVLGVIGAIVIGVTAFVRLITPPPALAGASQPTFAE